LLCSQHHLGEGRNKKGKEVKGKKKEKINVGREKKVKEMRGREEGT